MSKFLNTNIFVIHNTPVTVKHILIAIIAAPVLWAAMVGVFVF